MNKRLLSLLVFIPMFLIALYARNHSGPVAPSTNVSTGEFPSAENSRRANRRNRQSDSNDRMDREDRDRHEDRGDNAGDAGESRRSSSRQSHASAASSQPGVFDFYLLNLSWSPEFCSTRPDKPECAAHPGFVLHGLWPQNNDGSYPEHCSNAPGPTDPLAFRDLYPDAGLLRHEWTTHGTCSGLAPDTFFSQARAAVHAVRIPASLSTLHSQTAATPHEILSQFAQANPSIPQESLALSCGNNYLTAVEICLDHNLHATACSNIRSCRANSIRIVPPGGSSN